VAGANAEAAAAAAAAAAAVAAVAAVDSAAAATAAAAAVATAADAAVADAAAHLICAAPDELCLEAWKGPPALNGKLSLRSMDVDFVDLYSRQVGPRSSSHLRVGSHKSDATTTAGEAPQHVLQRHETYPQSMAWNRCPKTQDCKVAVLELEQQWSNLTLPPRQQQSLLLGHNMLTLPDRPSA